MPKITSNLKSLVGRTKTTLPTAPERAVQDDDDDILPASLEQASNGIDDVLQQLRIPLETMLPEDVMTTGLVQGVQFRVAKPEGYFYNDVHTFKEKVEDSIKWYARALHQRDLHVHKLATEVDKTRTDMANLRFQMEMLRGKTGKAIVNEDGSYVTEQQLVEDPKALLEVERVKLSDLQRRYNSLSEKHENLLIEVEELRHQQPVDSSALQEDFDKLQAYAQELEAYIEALDNNSPESSEASAYAEELQLQLDKVNNDTRSLENQISGLTEDLNESSAQLDHAHAEIQDLSAQLEAAQQQLTNQQNAMSTSVDMEAYEEEKNHHEALQEWAKEMEKSFDELEASYTQRSEEYETLAQENEHLKSLLESAQSSSTENEQLRLQVEELQIELSNADPSELLEEINALKKENLRLEQNNQKLEEENRLQKEYEESLSAHIDQLEEIIQNQNPGSIENEEDIEVVEVISEDDLSDPFAVEEERQLNIPLDEEDIIALDPYEELSNEYPQVEVPEEKAQKPQEPQAQEGSLPRDLIVGSELPDGQVLPSMRRRNTSQSSGKVTPNTPTKTRIRPEDL